MCGMMRFLLISAFMPEIPDFSSLTSVQGSWERTALHPHPHAALWPSRSIRTILLQSVFRERMQSMLSISISGIAHHDPEE